MDQRQQIYSLVNQTFGEIMGESNILEENLANLVDAGKTLPDGSKDLFVKTLAAKIGKSYFESKDLKLDTVAARQLRLDWEYGGILELVHCKSLPRVTEMEDYSLESGVSIDPYLINVPDFVSARYFENKIIFSIDMTFVDKQLKTAFTGAEAMVSFVAMLQNQIQNSLSMAITNLATRNLNDAIAEVINNNKTTQIVNLLSEYNTAFSQQLTATGAIYDKDFLRYSAFRIKENEARLAKPSALFNIDGEETWTTDLNTICLSDFYNGLKIYLYDAENQFNNGNLQIGATGEVPYWQATGTGYGFTDIASIKCKTHAGHTVDTKTAQKYILAVQYDNDALAIAQLRQETTSAYNPRGSYTNMFYKNEMGVFSQASCKNMIVYIVA